MQQFKDYINIKEFLNNNITESIKVDTKNMTDLLVTAVYSHYVKKYDKTQIESVGWLDGSTNAIERNALLYESIENTDSVLDVGCGVGHFYYFLESRGWTGKYLGIDPNAKAVELIDENINTMCGTIDGLPEYMKYDWVVASGVFNLGLKEKNTKWIIEQMIDHADKGVIFNMLTAPYKDERYQAYYPEEIKEWLTQYDHKDIKIVEGFDTEFTVHFYKEN